MRAETILLTSGSETEAERRYSEFAEHYGVSVKRLPLQGAHACIADAAASGSLLSVDLAAAAREPNGAQQFEALRDALERASASLLAFGAPDDTRDAGSLLSALTRGAIAGLEPLPSTPRSYQVTTLEPALAGVLSGLDTGAATACGSCALDVRSDVIPIVESEGRAFFARVRVGSASIYVLGEADLLGMDESFDRLNDLKEFPRFVPLLMVLRHVYGSRMWHASGSFASLVIDDPPLKRSYGYFDTRRLLAETESKDYAAAIAFIPYNRRRSDKQVAAMFREHAERLSVCVHGCDHTRAEFGSHDYERMRSAARTALERMDEHARRYSLDYDRVMVFPQGRFSAEAMKALRDEGYLAAANSGPVSVEESTPFSAREFLTPTIQRYGDFPLLVRRAAENPDEFVLDLFVGRPALIVAHPPDFRDGYPRIARVIDRLNGLPHPPRWAGLGQIARELYVTRELNGQHAQVRALSASVEIGNDGAEKRFTIVRRTPQHRAASVEGGRDPLALRHLGDLDAVTLALAGGERVRLSFASQPLAQGAPLLYAPRERAKIAVRNALCEVRDRYLVRSRTAYTLAKRSAQR